MLHSMRKFGCLSLVVVATLGGRSWGQSQTNITVQGDGQTQAAPAAKDTVKMVPEGSVVVPTPSGTAVIDDQAYTPPDTASEVGAIPPSQVKVLQNRRESKQFTGAGFGPAGFGNIDEKMPAYDVYAGHFWEVNKHAAIKALGEVASDFDRATLANLQLGANLYAMPTDISPYVGAGLGLGYGTVPGDRSFGFNVGASIGALLFRTSNAQMNLEGSAQTMLSELGEDKSMPTVYAARLGVLF
ncbi:MAG: hypothetical protein JWP91_3163 [Fibrobacteres bacterium]|nr:hypothetical protein [Fibrobacterota bacterium]